MRKTMWFTNPKILILITLALVVISTQAQTRNFVFRTNTFNSIDVGYLSAPTVIDIDSDGLLDLIIGCDDGYLVHFEQASINSTNFIAQTPANLQNSLGEVININKESIPFFVDLDNDGLLDLLIGEGNEDDGINHYEQTSINALTFDFVRLNLATAEDGDGRNRIYCGHIDDNNKLDMLFGTHNGHVYYNEQDAVYSNSFSRITTTFNSIDVTYTSSPTVTDFFADGILDLLVGDRELNNLQYFKQNSEHSLSFTSQTNGLLSSCNRTELTPCFVDLDGDGLLDILIGENGGKILHYEAEFTVTTGNVSNVTENSADCAGVIGYDNVDVTKGMVWSTSSNPTLSDSFSDQGNKCGAFTHTLTGLTKGTTYYVRSYVTIDGTTTYGNEKVFETVDVPELTTNEITNIGSTTATCGGIFQQENGSEVTAKGVCWSTSQNPTVSDSKTDDGTGTQSFTSSITGLSQGTTYYLRAYGTNSTGTGYGDERTFTTDDFPSVTTTVISSIGSTSANSGGNVTSENGKSVTARGVCWNTSENPTTSDNNTSDGSGLGSYTSSITGLSQGTIYYVRSYAINSVGTGYGAQESFSTDGVPTVTTNTIESIDVNSAVSGGNVTSENGESVTARGVCWSTNPNPTIDDSYSTNGTGLGEFTSNIVELQKDTEYYVRSYATNLLGTGYGAEIKLVTPLQLMNMLDFMGINQYITNNLTLPEQGTLETWVKLVTSKSQKIVQASDNYSDWYINYSASDGYKVKIGSPSILSVPYITSNKWHHIAITWSKSGVNVSTYFYMDGLLIDALIGTNLWTNPRSTLAIGSLDGTAGFLDGQLDEFRIWNYAKNSVEILAGMHRTIEPNSAGLLCYYTFNHTAGSILTDQTSNGYNGTLQNFENTDWITSTAPVGEDGMAVRSEIETCAGQLGLQIQTTIIGQSVYNRNYYGIYCYGDGSEIVNAETFPSGITQRPSIVWGACKVGNSSANIVLEYNNIPGVSDDSALKLLKRADASSAWIDFTSSAIQNTTDKTFKINAEVDPGEYSIADGGTNPLPVEFVSLTAQTIEKGIILTWQTATEVNNYGFEVQKSEVRSQTTEKEWEVFGFVEGHGNSNSPKEYSFVDVGDLSGEISYRLKQIDTDGSFEYSDIVVVELNLPKEFTLSQNYPNPFNPSTVIKYSIPANVKSEMANTKLAVYDMLGREVATLVNKQQEAGNYEVTFNASKLTSGIYFYRLQSGGFVETKKLVLLR